MIKFHVLPLAEVGLVEKSENFADMLCERSSRQFLVGLGYQPVCNSIQRGALFVVRFCPLDNKLL